MILDGASSSESSVYGDDSDMVGEEDGLAVSYRLSVMSL
jgi:hypothetical protein